jgi:FkbM family methyltransferase
MNNQTYFEHFSLKHRALAFVSRRFRDSAFTVRHGLIQGMKKRGGLGWVPFFAGQSENAETEFLRGLNLAGQTVYDVGGFEGVLTMFFSRRAANVVTYEANPENARRIRDNLALNGISNVILRETGVGDAEGELTLSHDPLMPGAGSGDAELRRQYESRSRGVKSFTVPVVPIDADRERNELPSPDFIKIDVEGMELSVLVGLSDTLRSKRPRLYLEMHGATMAEKDLKVKAIVGFLEQAGYGSILHVESGTQVNAGNAVAARQGHLYCKQVA